MLADNYSRDFLLILFLYGMEILEFLLDVLAFILKVLTINQTRIDIYGFPNWYLNII